MQTSEEGEDPLPARGVVVAFIRELQYENTSLQHRIATLEREAREWQPCIWAPCVAAELYTGTAHPVDRVLQELAPAGSAYAG